MKLVVTILSFVFLACNVAFGQQSGCETDRNVYDRIVQIKGKVTLVNQEGIAVGQSLVFQREGCKDCLVAVHTDIDGNYQLLVRAGTYKVIGLSISCDYGGVAGCTCYDMLVPEQPRSVEAKAGPYQTTFDIKLRVRTK